MEKAMAPHSSTVARKIPWTEKPGRLQSMGSLRVRHDWVTSLSLSTFMHWRRKWQPTPVFLPGESHGRRSLVGCSPWGRTESDTTEATWQQSHKYTKILLVITLAGSLPFFSSILADFLSVLSFKYLERGVKVSNYNPAFVYFSFQFYVDFTYFAALLSNACMFVFLVTDLLFLYNVSIYDEFLCSDIVILLSFN